MSTLLHAVVPPETQATLAGDSADGAKLLAQLEAFSVEDEASYEVMVELLPVLHKRHRLLEEQRRELFKPMADLKAAIDKLVPVAVFGKALELLKEKMCAYALARASREKAARDLAYQTGDTTALASLPAARVGEAPKGVKTSWTWEWRVVAFDDIPAEYTQKILDSTALKTYTKEWAKSEEIPPVPGLEFVRVEKISATGRT